MLARKAGRVSLEMRIEFGTTYRFMMISGEQQGYRYGVFAKGDLEMGCCVDVSVLLTDKVLSQCPIRYLCGSEQCSPR
jgi:hypothetical protein